LNSALVLTPLLLLGLCSACILPVLFRLGKKCRIEDISPEWLENFSASSYYVMQRLLSEEDFAFISRQPGFDLSVYRKLRRDRLRIFQQYLHRMITDFNRLHTVARFALAQSNEDRSALLSKLIWLKIRFSAAVVRVQFCYLLYFLGFPSLDVRQLIARLDEMTSRLTSISAAQLT
jgi:hypothetical protein